MDRPERIVDVRVGELGEPACERGVVVFFAGIEPQVLEQDDRGAGKFIGGRLSQRDHRFAQEFGEALPHGREPQSFLHRSFGPAEMGTEHKARPPLPKFGEGGQRGTDPRIVGHRTVLQGDVEVGAHEDTRLGHLAEIVEGAKGHSFEATRAARSTRRLE